MTLIYTITGAERMMKAKTAQLILDKNKGVSLVHNVEFSKEAWLFLTLIKKIAF